MDKMNDGILFNYLSSQEGLDHLIYQSPVGDLLLIGNEDSLKAVIFYDSEKIDWDLKKIFRSHINTSLFKASKFLDSYFFNPVDTPSYAISLSYSSEKYKNSPLRKIIDDEKNDITSNRKFLHLDVKPFTIKEINVYTSLLEVKWGETISYGELSEKSKIPSGGRFIGNTMAKNFFPILIPCHRVIRSDGNIGNYGGGTAIKEFLLNHEARKPSPFL